MSKKLKTVETDVFIAGSGPIGCAFAREILDKTKELNLNTKVWMAEIGAQNDPVIGAHHKNAIKYQKDIDSFVHVIQGALQAVSVPPASTHIPTLGNVAVTHIPEPKPPLACSWPHSDPQAQVWPPPRQDCTWPQWPRGKPAVSSFFNPNQIPEQNLSGCAVTRTVGGMATHWTCACPRPHPEEYKNCPIPEKDFLDLLGDAEKLLNVNNDEFDNSIRHTIVRGVLEGCPELQGRVRNLPLGVERDKRNPELVTWTGTDTVLGDWGKPENCCTKPECDCKTCGRRFSLHPEHKVIRLVREDESDPRNPTGPVEKVLIHNLRTHEKFYVQAARYVIACGAVCTPQILWNSGFGDRGGKNKPELRALGRYLTEQSLSFCQIVLKREIIRDIANDAAKLESGHPLSSLKLTKEQVKDIQERCETHQSQFGFDPIPIPFTDPEPQVNIKFALEKDETGKIILNKPWHAQIHRDAFSYGDVGPRADPRLIVDLRFFGRQEISVCNRVKFEDDYTDIYGLPQPTFEVLRSEKDAKLDHEMMLEMCEVANKLGAFLPGSYPQFMQPGLALHITGTTRIGRNDDDSDSVANQYSQVHKHENLYVGGNNVIPDSTACNPTLTSVAYACHASRHIVEYFKEKQPKAPAAGTTQDS